MRSTIVASSHRLCRLFSRSRCIARPRARHESRNATLSLHSALCSTLLSHLLTHENSSLQERIAALLRERLGPKLLVLSEASPTLKLTPLGLRGRVLIRGKCARRFPNSAPHTPVSQRRTPSESEPLSCTRISTTGCSVSRQARCRAAAPDKQTLKRRAPVQKAACARRWLRPRSSTSWTRTRRS